MTSPAGKEHPEPRRLGPGQRVQPDDYEPELLDGLEKFEDEDTARRLQRLVDQEIVLELQLQGFDTSTPEWRVFAVALAEYAYSVFMGWLVSGVVYRMAAQQGGGRGVYGLEKIPEGLRLRRDDAHAVAADLVTQTITAFRAKTLMNPNPDKRWRPDGGASIKSFFIGRCLMELPDVYRRWARQEGRYREQGANYAALNEDELPGQHTNTESAGTAAAMLDGLRNENDPTTMAMFELQAIGYSYEEIAEMLTSAGVPMNKTQVRSRMSRARVAARSNLS